MRDLLVARTMRLCGCYFASHVLLSRFETIVCLIFGFCAWTWHLILSMPHVYHVHASCAIPL